MVSAVISKNSICPIVALHRRISSKEYLDILGDQVHPMCQTLFSKGDCIFQDDNAPKHTAYIIKNLYEEHETELEHVEEGTGADFDGIGAEISTEKVNKLYDFIPSRIDVVLKCNCIVH